EVVDRLPRHVLDEGRRRPAAQDQPAGVEGDLRRGGQDQGRQVRGRRGEESVGAAGVTVATTTAVSLVDTDIHPVMLGAEQQRRLSTRWSQYVERYGRRAPHVTDLYPRPRNKGMRADAWPDGGVPGSDYDLMREQLLDEHDVDFGVLLCLNG